MSALESLGGRLERNVAPSQMPLADHELLDFSLFDLARRVKASRAMLFEGDKANNCQTGTLDRARSSLKKQSPPVHAGRASLGMPVSVPFRQPVNVHDAPQVEITIAGIFLPDRR
jgi:hypothetical protein